MRAWDLAGAIGKTVTFDSNRDIEVHGVLTDVFETKPWGEWQVYARVDYGRAHKVNPESIFFFSLPEEVAPPENL